MYGDSCLKYLKGDGTDICGLHQYEKLHMQFPVTVAQTNEYIDEGKRSQLIIEKNLISRCRGNIAYRLRCRLHIHRLFTSRRLELNSTYITLM